MKKETFELLMESLQEAKAHVKGKKTSVKVILHGKLFQCLLLSRLISNEYEKKLG